MSKDKGADNRPNQELKSREETISELLEFADGLAEEAKKITDTDEEVERLKRKIKSFRTDIEGLNQLNEKKFKTHIEKLITKKDLLLREVVDVQKGIAGWQEAKKEKEIKDLQARAALEDMEFTKFKEHYFDAEGRLGDFVNFIKKYNLEAGKEESVKNLEKLLNELKTSLDNKNYKDFTNKYDGFKYIVGGLLAKAYDEKTKQEEASKTTESAKDTEPPTVAPAAAPAAPPAAPEATPQATLADLLKLKGSQKESQKQRKAKGVVATKLAPSLGLRKDNAPDAATDGKEKKEQENKPIVQKTAAEQEKEAEEKEQRYLQRQKCVDDFFLLVKIIRDADKKENNYKLFDAAKKELAVLEDYLANQKTANNPEKLDLIEFNKNINAFNEAAKKLAASLGPDIKEAFERGSLPREIKPAEPKEDVSDETAARVKEMLDKKFGNKAVKTKPTEEAPPAAPPTTSAVIESEPAQAQNNEPAKPQPAPLATEATAPAEPVSKKRVGAKKTPERKMRILDIPERDLLEIVGEKKLQEVVNEIILGNADVAKVLMKDIFSRKDIDLKHLNNVLEKFGYTPVQFMKEWAETLHVRAFEVAKQWVEQMSRNWLNKNIKLWDKIKANPMAHAKLAAVNILPFAALGVSVGVFATTGGASYAARGAVVGGATGLLRGLKAKVGSVRGWFEKRKENAREQIVTGGKKIEEEKAIPLRDSLLAQFTGENGPDMMEQLSAMLSQSLRDAGAAGVQKEAVEKLKSGAAVAVEEISAKIDAEFKVMKKSAGEETAKEVQRSQTERAETLIKALYDDKDLEALIQKLIERDPKIVSKLKGLKINGVEFGKFIKPDDKDPVKKESNARKAASILASVAAGASIGGAIAAAPELRAVLGAVVGGYLGVKYGHLKDRHAREAQFEKEFKDSVANAEKVIQEWETRQVKEPLLEPTPENIKELAERAKDLRAPLTLGMLEGDINLKLRAQNALRRLESLQINLYINQNPMAEEQPIPEAQRNRGVERLLTGLNSELEELTKHQQNIEQRILRKPGWWRAVGYGIVGAVAGAGAGYGTAKAQEYWRGHHKPASHPTAEEGVQQQQAAPEHVAVAPAEQAHPLEHPSTSKPHEAPVPTETEVVAHGDHTVAVEVLNDKEGVLNGVNKIIHDHPDVFTHPDGKAWTAAEIHTWKVHELKAMGFKIEGDKWGNPMTVHAGAQVEVYTDEQGQPHFKLASDEHVTFNKNYKWVETEHKEPFKIVDTGAVAGRKGDYLINPFPDEHGVSSVAHAPIKVDASIKDMAVHHAPKVSEGVSKGGEINNQKVAPENITPTKSSTATPEKIAAAPETVAEKGTLDQVLAEQKSGYDKKEFLGTFQNMRGTMAARLENSLSHNTEGAKQFLQSKFDYLYERQLHYDSPLDNAKLSNVDTEQIKQLLRAEYLYKNGKSGWEESLDKAMFSKDDSKVMHLAFAPHTNPGSHPIITNNSHAARIWDPIKKKDVFWYEKNTTFNLDKNGNLVVKDAAGQRVVNKNDALRLARSS